VTMYAVKVYTAANYARFNKKGAVRHREGSRSCHPTRIAPEATLTSQRPPLLFRVPNEFSELFDAHLGVSGCEAR
jgi:hypothetical protein